MAREVQPEQTQASVATESPVVESDVTTAHERFSDAGPLPEIHGTQQTAAPTASQLVYGDGKENAPEVTAGLKHRADGTHVDLGTQQQISKLRLSEELGLTVSDQGTTTQAYASLTERYRSDRVAHSATVEAGVGERDYMNVKGAVDVGLGDRLYGGAFGSYSYEAGKQDTAHIGASLTFTPRERQALTLAGVIDQDGDLEARLQFDLFKSRVDSVSSLADHKKKALISLFVSYRVDSGKRVMDERYGKPNVDAGDGNQITGGIRIKF